VATHVSTAFLRGHRPDFQALLVMQAAVLRAFPVGVCLLFDEAGQNSLGLRRVLPKILWFTWPKTRRKYARFV